CAQRTSYPGALIWRLNAQSWESCFFFVDFSKIPRRMWELSRPDYLPALTSRCVRPRSIQGCSPRSEFLRSPEVQGGQRGAGKSEEFRQTFGWIGRIIAVDRKTGRQDLSMAHNVLDGIDHYEEHVDRHRKASHQNRLPGSQPSDVCAIILMKLSRSIRSTGKSVAMWVCGVDPRNQ